MDISNNADAATDAEDGEYVPPTVSGVTTQALLNSQSTPWTINAGAAIASMSSNPSMSQVVVAGREILKIYSTDTLGEVLNIRFGRVNMHYSSNDVRWNPNESHSHLIATAATNGHVVIWNLNMKGKKLGTCPSNPPPFLDHSTLYNMIYHVDTILPCFHRHRSAKQ